jgi:3-oxoacyl-[acyl-carrier protein] reductase
MDLKLKNRRVLVTGSTRGIGYGIASAFVKEGARVMLTGRDAKTLKQRCQTLERSHVGSRINGFAGDLTDEAVIKDLAEKCQAVWRGLDALVLNLGSGKSVPGVSVDADEWRRVLDLNLVSTMSALRELLPLMKNNSEASITFVGSIAGLESLGAPLPYVAAKAGLTLAMKSTAQLLAPRGIRVNLVAPGNIFFKGGTWDRKLRENSKAVEEMLKTQVPMQRLGRVSEIADLVVFLASPKASFVTGACVVADGGQMRSV